MSSPLRRPLSYFGCNRLGPKDAIAHCSDEVREGQQKTRRVETAGLLKFSR